jgi:hypothetical protein
MHLRASELHWKQLQKTARRIYSGTCQDRAGWMILFYRSGAWSDLKHDSDQVADRFGITERVRDSCGEMGDCPEVIAEVMREVDRDPSLGHAITECEGAGCLDRWRELATHVPQLALF